MDFGCLLGACSVVAQVVGGDAAAAQTPEPLATATADDSTDLIIRIGVFIFIAAQLLAPVLLWRYHRGVLRAMNSDAAPDWMTGPPVTDVGALIATVQRRHRRTLVVLGVTALVFACPAGWFFAYPGYPGVLERVSLVASIAMFAALAVPIVMLGGSALHFRRQFWGQLAPFAVMAAAVQFLVAQAYQRLWRLESMAVDLEREGKQDEAAQTKDEIDLSVAYWGDYLLHFIATLVAVGAACFIGWRLLGAERRAVTIEWVKRHWLIASGLCLVTLGAAGFVADQYVEEKRMVLHVLFFAVAGLLGIALLYFSLGSRSQRIVVPLLALAGFAMVTVAAITHELSGNSLRFVLDSIDSRVVNLPWLNDGPLPTTARVAVQLAAVGMAVIAAWFALSWIGLAYEQKVFSDAQFEVFTWVLSIAAMVAFIDAALSDVDPLHGSNIGVMASAVVALLVYWILSRLQQPPRLRARLLLLRVFKSDNRGERLLDEIARRWRFVGPIMMIGGPDLARATVDPSEISQFMRLRLQGDFVNGEAMLERKIHAMDEDPDPDGRYRINEFYCRRNIWQVAVERLVGKSDAILLDLRGYDRSRAGLTFEIHLLGRMGVHDRTVFLLDASTDLDLVIANVGEAAWAAIPEAQRIRTEQDVDGEALFAALAARALRTKDGGTAKAHDAPSPQVLATG